MQRLILTIVLLTLGPAARADNLLINPDFDSGLAGWNDFNHGTFAFDTRDHDNAPGSGSARIDKTQCCSSPDQFIDITDPDVRYHLDGFAMPLVPGDDGGTSAWLTFNQYDVSCDQASSPTELRFFSQSNKALNEWSRLRTENVGLFPETRCVRLALDYREFSGSVLYDGLVFGPQPIDSRDSAAYFNPDRNGEGFVLMVETIDDETLVFATWYTYLDGQQLWLAGNAATDGSGRVSIPLIQTAGTGFGDAFDGDDVEVADWGTVDIRFTDCGRMAVTYESLAGDAGELEMMRLIGPESGHCGD